jgi:hypothetical protein
MKVYRIERTHLGTVHATVNGTRCRASNITASRALTSAAPAKV